jgi:MFS family permease
VPLRLFGDRNFSISNFAISTMSFTATAMGFPIMIYAQLVRGDSPLVASLLLVPMAVMSIILAPIVGRFTDRVHPRILTGAGFAITAVAIYLLSQSLTASGSVLPILGSMALLGIGMAGIWAPLAATATRNLPMNLAGAGSGVYNATRQVGAVLGSAAIAVLLDARLAAHGLSGGQQADSGVVQQLPAIVRAPFSEAMSETLLLPVGVLLLGLVSVMFFQLPRHLAAQRVAAGTGAATGAATASGAEQAPPADAPAPVLD